MPDYSNETELKNEDQFEELEIEKVKSEIEGDSTANLTIREADGENDFVTIQIDESKAKTRLDKLICQELDLSRARVEALIDDGMVCLNGQVAVKASKKVQVGDVLEIELPEPESTDVLPEKMDLDIVYEDSDIIVINKQRGLVVHPAPGHYMGTLVNGLLYHCQDLSGINGVARPVSCIELIKIPQDYWLWLKMIWLMNLWLNRSWIRPVSENIWLSFMNHFLIVPEPSMRPSGGMRKTVRKWQSLPRIQEMQ